MLHGRSPLMSALPHNVAAGAYKTKIMKGYQDYALFYTFNGVHYAVENQFPNGKILSLDLL